ncbi:MAG: S8 family serine peptidase [Puniceicoccaceae bacterium]
MINRKGLQTRIRIALRYWILSCIILTGLEAADKEVSDSPESKIDPQVLARTKGGLPLQVTILCSTQLLEMPHGFGEFCEANANANRLELRSQVIKELKAIAANGEQKAIIKALPSRTNPVQHWIVNAVSARINQKQAKAIAAMEEVKYIYNGFPPLPGQRKRRLSEVIPYTEESSSSKMKGAIPWNLKAIGADQVWKRKNVAGENVVVAMLEGGIDYTHKDLRNNIWINRFEKPDNGKDDDNNGWIDDYYGFNFRTGNGEVIPQTERHHHGTMTSGIVVGDGSGGIITGVAPRAKVMLLSGHAVYAYQYALEQGADILSMSFSVPKLGNSRGLWRLMSEHAVCAGMVLISGCGNFQQSEKIPVQIRVPEGIPCVIGAGGLDKALEVPRFCSLGPVEWGSVKFYSDYALPEGLTKPDICAFPGPGYPQLSPEDGQYIQNRRGNSFSSPHIAGVAALMLSTTPELPAWRVKEIMEATAIDVGDPGKDNRTGAGLVNALKAVTVAEEFSALP